MGRMPECYRCQGWHNRRMSCLYYRHIQIQNLLHSITTMPSASGIIFPSPAGARSAASCPHLSDFLDSQVQAIGSPDSAASIVDSTFLAAASEHLKIEPFSIVAIDFRKLTEGC